MKAALPLDVGLSGFESGDQTLAFVDEVRPNEDDVHESIKYNVWSSTPNGNKKLNNAYEDAQRIAAADSRGCPIFIFFSVNTSGQFCGVAEMTGPVDFHKDMDFRQQDKWSGRFPVKWHMIKNVPNPNFKHIILENNENKLVTNSRDTQELGRLQFGRHCLPNLFPTLFNVSPNVEEKFSSKRKSEEIYFPPPKYKCNKSVKFSPTNETNV
ncbi:putative high-glucose-regulated protein [Forsythia ovata]|uniref:YTH domain-containing family protein n=1 Tax=Forsythia ovata TaxID=205694 RepID=A0ABD1WSL9_9LAMI